MKLAPGSARLHERPAERPLRNARELRFVLGKRRKPLARRAASTARFNELTRGQRLASALPQMDARPRESFACGSQRTTMPRYESHAPPAVTPDANNVVIAATTSTTALYLRVGTQAIGTLQL